PEGSDQDASQQQGTRSAARLINVCNFHVNWNNPANSSFTLRTNVPAAVFTELSCDNEQGGRDLNCVPQLGIPDPLDAISDRLMFRNAYRRFPDGRESMLNNFTVSANSVAG